MVGANMNAYWSQWSPTQLMSMHGVELDDYHVHEDSHEDREEEEDQDDCCSSICMECLGLSWSDFM
jgi:hypothetical protein